VTKNVLYEPNVNRNDLWPKRVHTLCNQPSPNNWTVYVFVNQESSVSGAAQHLFHGYRTTLFKGRVRERPETLQGQSSRRTLKNRSAARRIAWSGSAEPCGRGFFTSLWMIGWLIARRCYRTLCPRLCQSHQTSSLGMCIYSLRRRYKFVAS